MSNKNKDAVREETQNERKKVLIIEDEASLRGVLADNLGDKGFRVLEARDGQEGFDLAMEERPDVILLDIKLPKMNGMRVMQKLRQSSEYGKNVPIMLLTNLSANQNIVKGVMKDRPAYYIEKAGYSISEVIEKAHTLAAGKQSPYPAYLAK